LPFGADRPFVPSPGNVSNPFGENVSCALNKLQVAAISTKPYSGP
jgi:hypothetical protein